MAAITTYLLISGIEEPGVVQSHALFEEHDFELRDRFEPDGEQLPALQFAMEHPIEEAVDLEEDIRQLSVDVPEATVVMCEVEERFDHVERLQLNVFSNGKRGGNIEHGYVLNIGS